MDFVSQLNVYHTAKILNTFLMVPNTAPDKQGYSHKYFFLISPRFLEEIRKYQYFWLKKVSYREL